MRKTMRNNLRENGDIRGLRARTAGAGIAALLMAGTVTGCGVSELIGGGTASPEPTATATAPKKPKLPPKPEPRSFEQTEGLAKRAMAKLNGEAFTKVGCRQAGDGVAKFGALLERSRQVLGLDGDRDTITTAYRWKVQSYSVRPRGKPDATMNIVFENDRGRWCVADVSAWRVEGPQFGIASEPRGPVWDQAPMAGRYVTLLNSGDLTEAASFHTSVDENLAIAERELRADLKGVEGISIDRSVPMSRNGEFTLKATRNGKPVKGTLTTSNDAATEIATVVGVFFLT